MTRLEQIHKDIDTLPEEAQVLLVNFIEFLKYRYLLIAEKDVDRKDKLIDLMQFSNTINWDVDGLDYQKRLRMEWE